MKNVNPYSYGDTSHIPICLLCHDIVLEHEEVHMWKKDSDDRISYGKLSYDPDYVLKHLKKIHFTHVTCWEKINATERHAVSNEHDSFKTGRIADLRS